MEIKGEQKIERLPDAQSHEPKVAYDPPQIVMLGQMDFLTGSATGGDGDGWGYAKTA